MKWQSSQPIDSPFRWREYPRPSIFLQDVWFRAPKDGRTASQAATSYVEKARVEGKMAGFIKGISKRREEEVLRMRNFAIYSVATAKPKVKK